MRTDRHVVLVWIGLLALLPLMAGGVVVGDEAALLSLARAWDALHITAHEFFLRAPYAFHQMPWFIIVYSTQRLVGFVTHMALVTESVISTQTVAAGLAACAITYAWLVGRQDQDRARAALVMLGFFFGGYGLFIAFMGEAPECYMALLMAARLFAAEPSMGRQRAIALGLIDGALIVFKIYSVIFVGLMLPLFWQRADRSQQIAYGATVFAVATVVVVSKFSVWNPPAAYIQDLNPSAPAMLSRFFQQLISPWTGLAFCMPFVLILFLMPHPMWRNLAVKSAAIAGCMAFFSLYVFFDGDHPGGRYVFPFLIVLVPEIAAGFMMLTVRWPKAAFVVPLLLLVFLPVGLIGLPFYPGENMRTWDPNVPTTERCMPEHPALFAWKMFMGHVTGTHHVPVCLRGRKRVLDPDEAAIPHTGPGRVAFILAGGVPHDYAGAGSPHRAMSVHLRKFLVRVHLDSVVLWNFLTLLPPIVLLAWSLIAAILIARGSVPP